MSRVPYCNLYNYNYKVTFLIIHHQMPKPFYLHTNINTFFFHYCQTKKLKFFYFFSSNAFNKIGSPAGPSVTQKWFLLLLKPVNPLEWPICASSRALPLKPRRADWVWSPSFTPPLCIGRNQKMISGRCIAVMLLHYVPVCSSTPAPFQLMTKWRLKEDSGANVCCQSQDEDHLSVSV